MASSHPSLNSSSEDKFRESLLCINSELNTEDLEAIKFLCQDLISNKKLENSRLPLDIFNHLMEEELLSEKNPSLLAELLYISKKSCLLYHLSYTKENVKRLHDQGRGSISLFRKLLYDLSENIGSEELAGMMFLMKAHIPNTSMTSLSFLAYLEKQDIINENNVEKLEEILSKCSPNLIEKVKTYKKKKDDQLKTSSKNQSLHQEKEVSYLDLKHFSETLQVSEQNEHANNGDRAALTSMEMLGAPANISTKEPEVYRMNRKYRGYCVIINNKNFTSMPERLGTDKDAESLSHVFAWLEFNVCEYDDVSKSMLEEILKEYQKHPGHEERDCFVFCILSHGINGAVYTSDGACVSLQKIMSHFTLQQCPGLAHKPKLFFIQACQGSEIQPSVAIQADAVSYESKTLFLKHGCPDWVDFLFGMSTFPGYVSFRNTKKGSWYIQSLCNHLKDLIPRHQDILSILTAVNKDVSEQTDAQGLMKQIPQPSFTLCKRLEFPVPQGQPLQS